MKPVPEATKMSSKLEVYLKGGGGVRQLTVYLYTSGSLSADEGISTVR